MAFEAQILPIEAAWASGSAFLLLAARSQSLQYWLRPDRWLGDCRDGRWRPGARG